MKTVFKKGYMYRLSACPSMIIYISENKTLAGKEDRPYEGEASGRKLVVSFFEDAGEGLVQRVDRTTLVLKQHLLSLAELLQTLGGFALPPDPDRTAANTELLLETLYQNLELRRFECTSEPAAGVLMFSLDDDVDAEAALACELAVDHRTKMVLARCLQRNEKLLDEETLQTAWNSTLVILQERTAPLLPAAPAVPLAGRGRGRGRGAPPALPAPPAAPLAAPLAGQGRGRGRGAPPAGQGRGRGRR
jgi:hypothetical protein